MGLDRTIRFPTDDTPSWEAIRLQLSRLGLSPSLRLIDGLPAFPDESPGEEWKELRIGTDGGMVTLRRDSGSINCVIWGNADAALETAWLKVIWACASSGDGVIDLAGSAVSPEQFARSVGLSPE